MGEGYTLLPGLIIAEPLPDGGYTSTLPTLLGKMLFQAERLYGPRDTSYTILGIEFYDSDPLIWYPENRKHVVVRLSLECMEDLPHACLQLAHECIHLLGPSGRKETTVLDEGLATHFSKIFLRDVLKMEMTLQIPSYEEAALYVEELLSIDNSIIKRLREQVPLYEVKPEDILAVEPKVPEKLAKALGKPFIRE